MNKRPAWRDDLAPSATPSIWPHHPAFVLKATLHRGLVHAQMHLLTTRRPQVSAGMPTTWCLISVKPDHFIPSKALLRSSCFLAPHCPLEVSCVLCLGPTAGSLLCPTRLLRDPGLSIRPTSSLQCFLSVWMLGTEVDAGST